MFPDPRFGFPLHGPRQRPIKTMAQEDDYYRQSTLSLPRWLVGTISAVLRLRRPARRPAVRHAMLRHPAS